MAPPRYSLVPWAAAYQPAYLEFARAMFGAKAHQSSVGYLQWLYERSPLATNDPGTRLALDETGRVVGCVHVLRMTWKFRGEVVVVPALHNAIMDPAHRHGVSGGLLIMESFKGQPHAFIPGAVGKLAETYRRIGFVTLPTEWRAKWLRPIPAGAAWVLQRLGLKQNHPQPRIRLSAERGREGVEERPARPANPAEVREVVSFANRLSENSAVFAPHWTEALFFWRFFDSLGPRHWLVTQREAGRLVGYLVVSLGTHHGLTVARGVEWRAESAETLQRLLEEASKDAVSSGAHLFLLFGGETEHNRCLAASGWASWRRPPQTLIYHRDRAVRSAGHAFMPSAGDYGFEAFPNPGTE